MIVAAQWFMRTSLRPGENMQLSRTLIVLLALAGLLSSGCAARVYGRGRAVYSYSAPVVFVSAPALVYVEPGVYVVRDYDDAVYYSDGYYWSYRGGVWYHTAHWSSPWSVVGVGYVPRTVAYRDHRAYAHYHGHAGAHTYYQPASPHHAPASANPSASAHHPSGSSHQPAGPSAHVAGASGARKHHDDSGAQSRPSPKRRSHGDQPNHRVDPAAAPRSRADAPQPRADAPQPRADAPQPRADAPAATPQPRADAPAATPEPRADAPRKKKHSSQSAPSRSKKKSQRQ